MILPGRTYVKTMPASGRQYTRRVIDVINGRVRYVSEARPRLERFCSVTTFVGWGGVLRAEAA